MAFFDKISDVASSFGDKANEAIETTKLKSRINTEKKAMELEFAKIGKVYYEKAKREELELLPDVEGVSERIDTHYKVLEDLEKMMQLYTEKL